MKSFFKWAVVVCFPAVGFTNMLQNAAKEDPKTTVKQFTDAVPKIASGLSKFMTFVYVLLAVGGFLYVKNTYFPGGRRAFR